MIIYIYIERVFCRYSLRTIRWNSQSLVGNSSPGLMDNP